MSFDPSVNLPFDTEDCQCCTYSYDECICPECPTCGEQGEPSCYVTGSKCGLVETPEQQEAIEETEAEERRYMEYEATHIADMFADAELWEMENYEQG